MSALIAIASGVVVVALAWVHRPAVLIDRVGHLMEPTHLDGVCDSETGRASRRESAARPVELARGLGARIAAVVPALAPVGEVWIGVAAVVGAALAPWSPVVAGVSMAALVGAGVWRQGRRRRRDSVREAEQVVALLQVVAVTVVAGGTLRGAIEALWSSFDGPLGARLARAHTHLEAGATIEEAVDALTVGMAADHVALFDRIRGAESAGAPVGALVRSAADRLATRRRHDAEIRARRLPVLMLLPLVCCVLPAFVVLAIVPMVVSGLPSLFPFP